MSACIYRRYRSRLAVQSVEVRVAERFGLLFAEFVFFFYIIVGCEAVVGGCGFGHFLALVVGSSIAIEGMVSILPAV